MPHAGVGEIRLLQPALMQLARDQPIAFVHPPYAPHTACWQGWHLNPEQLLWVAPQRAADTLWATEQILKHGSCGALLCWLADVRPESLRRLHLVAQATDTLFFVIRPATVAQQASPALLRLALAPASGGLSVHILKRRGPTRSEPLLLPLDPAHHGSVARPLSTPATPRRRSPALVS